IMSSRNCSVSASIATRPLKTSIPTSHRLMSLQASGWVSSRRFARRDRRAGASASWIRTWVSRTTTLGAPALAGGRDHIANAGRLAQRFEAVASGFRSALGRQQARHRLAARGDAQLAPLLHLLQVRRQILAQLGQFDVVHRGYNASVLF